MRTGAQVVRVAFTYIGTVVGAGFASGQEILQFFTRYGSLATLTIALATLLFIWIGIQLMLMAYDLKAASYEDLNKVIFGERIGKWISLFMMVVLFGITTVMLAGAGTVFEEQLHLSYTSGLLVTLVLSYLILTRGIKAIMTVNSIVVPIMLLFSVVIVVYTWHSPSSGNWLRITSDDTLGQIWFAPFLYTAFNLAMAQAVLVPMGAAMTNRSTLISGGLLGGAGIGLLLLSAHYALSAQMPGIAQFEIPMGSIMTKLGPLPQLAYLLVIYGEIFTTFIGDAYGLSMQLQQRTKLPPKVLLLLILSLSYLISHIGFKVLLSALYPIFGLISVVWLVLMIWRNRRSAL
ncbi:YkvI family membrane protein [Paenibacillus ferrarius]|uniref:YkvI family membrane protein n=1 Tax=Paenibacillus ferrarius TaxID=1469647 RepID=UPI003D276B26